MRRLTRRFARFIGSSIAAVLVVAGGGAVLPVVTSAPICGIACNGPGNVPPTPVPVDPSMQWIADLPLQGQSPTWTAAIQQCDTEAGCPAFVFNWYGIVNEAVPANYIERQFEIAAVTEVDMMIVIPNGDAAPWRSGQWAMGALDKFYSEDTHVNDSPDAFFDPTCPPPIVLLPGGTVRQGCTRYARLGPWRGLNAKFEPVVSGPEGTSPVLCSVIIPGCPWQNAPTWRHRLIN